MSNSISSLPSTTTTRARGVPPAPQPGTREFNQVELIVRLRRNPLTIWRKLHFTKPIISGKSLLGYGVVVSDPAAIRHILTENAGNYRKDDLQRTVLAPGLGDGLLTAEGDVWRRTRRMVAPLFTPRRVAAMASSMMPAIEAMVTRLQRRRAGRVVDVSHDMTRVTYDVLAQTLFSNVIAGGASDFSAALTGYFETQGQIDPLDILGAPAWVPRIGRIMARPSISFFERKVTEIILERQALLDRPDVDPPDDLLTALMNARDPENGDGLTTPEVGANIVTFIGAGHETTANVLTWALYLLSLAPDICEEIEREAGLVGTNGVAAALSGEGLVMTKAVIEETMRLYPPVPSLSRSAIAADRVAQTDIPKGALVVIAPYVLHRHETLWDKPNLFRPERFLEPARQTIDRYAYLPFGAGPRVCIGQQFAMVEAVMVLSTLVRHFRFSYAGDAPPEPLHRITLRPKGGMPMRMSPRTTQ